MGSISMEKPGIEEKLIIVLSRIENAIGSIGHILEAIDDRKRFPIISSSEEGEERMKEWRKDQYANDQIEALEKQNKILLRTVKVAVASVVVTAVVGVADVIIKLFFTK